MMTILEINTCSYLHLRLSIVVKISEFYLKRSPFNFTFWIENEYSKNFSHKFVYLFNKLHCLLQSLGRNFRDFFVNLDNLHDYLKYTFQR
jgi:hypothetical protein